MTLYVSPCHARLPDTPTSLVGPSTPLSPAAVNVAASFRKYSRIEAPPRAAGTCGALSTASSTCSRNHRLLGCELKLRPVIPNPQASVLIRCLAPEGFVLHRNFDAPPKPVERLRESAYALGDWLCTPIRTFR